jgi:ribosomal protein S18 acetylase RimI-like enzyme
MRDYVLTTGYVERERAEIVALLREYEAAIGVSLGFQDFADELANLPGAYAPPQGAMILARDAERNDLVGCVAVRPVPHSPGLCEMKRLYVRRAARGSGLGRRLALAAMSEARRMRYARICLDTLPGMQQAQALYDALGFRRLGLAATDPPVLLFERALGEEP